MENFQAVLDGVAQYGTLIGIIIVLVRFFRSTPTKSDMDNRFIQVNGRIDKLAEKVESNSRLLSAHSVKMGELTKEVSEQKVALQKQDEKWELRFKEQSEERDINFKEQNDKWDRKFERQGVKLDALTESFAEQQVAFARQETRLDGLGEKIDDMNTALVKQHDRLDSFQQQTSARFDEVNANVTRTRESVLRAQGDVKALSSNVLALRDKTDRIERDMEATRNQAVPAR